MFALGLGVGVRVKILSEGNFQFFTQYVVRIETLIRGSCPEGILSKGILFKGIKSGCVILFGIRLRLQCAVIHI